MKVDAEYNTDEVQRVKASINGLGSVLTLPAIWKVYELSQIASTLLDLLLERLHLDFVYLRLSDFAGISGPINGMVEGQILIAHPEEISRLQFHVGQNYGVN